MKKYTEVAQAIKSAYKKPYGYFSWSFTVFFFIVTIFIFLREPLVVYYLNSKIQNYKNSHHAIIQYQSISFKGLSTATIHGFSLQKIDCKPLIEASSVELEIDFWKLFRKRLSIENIEVDDCKINIEKKGPENNFDFLFKSNKQQESNAQQEKNLAKKAESIVELVFDILPNKMNVKNLQVNISNSDHVVQFSTTNFSILDHQFDSKIIFTETGKSSVINAIGKVDKVAKEISIKMTGEDRSPISIPWIKYRNNSFVCFDTINFRLKSEELTNSTYHFSGMWLANNLQIFHKRVATDTVKFENIGNEFKINIGANYVEMDSTSTVTINRLQIHPYAHFIFSKPKKIILSLYKPFFPADELFSSLPNGLFNNLEGIKVAGELSYQGYFELDMAQPDSLIFKSDLIQKKFQIIEPGFTDLKKINSPFIHTIFDKDMEVKKVELSPNNPNFISFNQIPRSLINSILMSEDGWFFEHGGFSIGAFRESIIENIKRKRFARGGSTISMQLVKNLFLNKNKNIARKLEEMLIVWLIERNRLSTKERMFEIYVNIIEWGPGIYGAKEASTYYFNKDISELTLDESIFLAAIIPSPKNYRYLFNDDFSFKEYIINHYTLVLKRMVEHELIPQSEADLSLMKVALSKNVKEEIINRKAIINSKILKN